MGNIFERMVTEPIQRFLERVLLFLPNLFSAIVIFIIGLFAAWIAKYLLGKFFRFLKVDELSEKTGISSIIAKSGLRESLSSLIARFVGWVIIVAFAIIALSAMNIFTIERLVERFFLYLPNVFVAIVIVILGSMLANFLGRAALIAAVNAGLRVSGLVGKAVKLSIFIFALSIALEQMGIGKDTVIIAFTVIFGGVVSALALAFGLGGRDIAREYLEKKIKGGEKEDEISHL